MADNLIWMRHRNGLMAQPHEATATGAIASFRTDVLSPLKVGCDITPVQDLNGQESPYPPGGGKNKMQNAIPTTVTDNGITFTVASNGVISVKGTATANALGTFMLDSPFVIPSGDPKPKFCLGNSVANKNVSFKFFNGDTQVDSWACTPAKRSSEYTGMQGKTCDRYIVIVNAGEVVDMTISPMIVENSVTDYTYVPYSNICPITGWTGANVTRTGKNLTPNFINNDVSGAGLTCKLNDDGSITVTGTATNTSAMLLSMQTVSIPLPSGTYTFNIGITDTNNKVYCQIVNNGGHTLHSRMSKDTYTFNNPFTITRLDLGINVASGETINVTIKPQLEFGSTASDYVPFVGTTYPISWQTEAGTVYGGTLDVTTGVLTVDKAIVDMGTRTWTFIQPTTGIPYGTFYNTILEKKYGQTNILCENYPVKAGFTNDKAIQGNASANTVYLTDSGFNGDADALKEALNGAHLVYELATPVTYQLTPTEITALLGQNHVLADTGDVSVEYWGH